MARKDARSRKRWQRARKAEQQFGTNLRKLAKQVANIIEMMTSSGKTDQKPLEDALNDYAQMIEPWAEKVAARMLADVNLRDSKSFEGHAREMGRLYRLEMREGPTGAIMRKLQGEQVELIKSLPLEAAKKVHELAQAAQWKGLRFTSFINQIQALGDITRNRAKLIARTEVGRASTNIMQARATFAGSEGYIWRTSEDGDVRPSHRKMNGRFVKWGDPPTLDGLTGHAGALPNCRCYPEPVFPED